MNKLKSIAKIVAAVGGVAGAHFMLPETYSLAVEAIVAAAAVLARSPIDSK